MDMTAFRASFKKHISQRFVWKFPCGLSEEQRQLLPRSQGGDISPRKRNDHQQQHIMTFTNPLSHEPDHNFFPAPLQAVGSQTRNFAIKKNRRWTWSPLKEKVASYWHNGRWTDEIC
ncbi:hypothetical protein VU07_01705 [Desulfobulbus sp. F4]|nr:hypothetical protein [Desulfobulbus sp. F4]